MGLSSALSVATSGLRANAVQSDLIARNIANATSEGYTRKTAELITQNGSVFVNSITREVDGLLDQLDRQNKSDVSRTYTIADGLRSYTDLLGQPNDETSPAAGLSQLYTSLVTLSGTSSLLASQHGAVETAMAHARQVNNLATAVTELGREVEMNIRYDVADVNERLTRLAQINTRLMQAGDNGTEAAELRDEQGRLLDQISEFMDIRTTQYGDGAVNVYTGSGTELLSGKRVNPITYNSGSSKLYAGEVEITPGSSDARGFTSGSLAGLFELKTTHLPRIQSELDGYAGLLITRFAAADPTLAAGQQGLFVDAQSTSGALRIAGLASRLTVNQRLDPNQGGDPSLLQSGLGTNGTIQPGSPTIIENMMRQIDQRVAGATPLGDDLSLTDFATSMVATQQQQRASAERSAASALTSGDAISASRQNLQGVNIDDEMQKLLVIEQSYAANARVLTAVKTMLDDLLNAV